MLKQISNLAISYGQLAVIRRAKNSSEGSSGTVIKISCNPLFDGNTWIQTRTLRLDVPCSDGSNSWSELSRPSNLTLIVIL